MVDIFKIDILLHQNQTLSVIKLGIV